MMFRKLLLTVALLVVGSCATAIEPRVRHEWRSLTPEMHQRVADAMWTMKRTPTTNGKQLYGNDFMNYDEFVLRHVCATLDPRCDQGHASPSFATYHRAFLLLFEKSLLAVDPEIGALPYWDVALDSQNGGRYYQVEGQYIFSDDHFGDFVGNATENYMVTNGLFANWPVSEFSKENFANLDIPCVNDDWFKGTTSVVCQRCCGNEDCTCTDQDEFVTFMRDHDDCNPFITRNGNLQPPNHVGGLYELQFTQDDFDTCTDPALIRTWMDWMRCSEISNTDCFVRKAPIDVIQQQVAPLILMTPGDEAAKNATMAVVDGLTSNCAPTGFYNDVEGIRRTVNAHHGPVHFRVGGDLEDVATSPNDPIFWFYHADIDRSNMQWQLATNELESVFWEFPTSPTEDEPVEEYSEFSGPFSFFAFLSCGSDPIRFNQYAPFQTAWYSGTLLDDEISSGFPFLSGLFANPPANGVGYTNREVLTYTTPDTTPYTYDTLGTTVLPTSSGLAPVSVAVAFMTSVVAATTLL